MLAAIQELLDDPKAFGETVEVSAAKRYRRKQPDYPDANMWVAYLAALVAALSHDSGTTSRDSSLDSSKKISVLTYCQGISDGREGVMDQTLKLNLSVISLEKLSLVSLFKITS